MARRHIAALAPVLLLVGVLAACASGAGPTGQVVCPAIGWTDMLAVKIEGDSSRVDQVRVCDEDGCWPDPDSSTNGPVFQVNGDGDHWSFTLVSLPDPVTVLVTDRTGAVLGEAEVDPEWERVGGSAQCGGPHMAAVTVHV